MQSHNAITQYLLSVGVPRNYKGFSYLVMAIEYTIEDGALYIPISKVYKAVADQCQTSPTNVERNIRTLRDIYWERKPVKMPFMLKPTNADMIATFSDHIQQRLEKAKGNLK